MMEDLKKQVGVDKELTADTLMANTEGKNLEKTTAIVDPGSTKNQCRRRSPAPVVTPSKSTHQKRALITQQRATKINPPTQASRSVSLQPAKGVTFKETKATSRSRSNTPDSSKTSPKKKDSSKISDQGVSKSSDQDSSKSSNKAPLNSSDKKSSTSSTQASSKTYYKDAAKTSDKVIKAKKKKKKKHTPIQDQVNDARATAKITDDGPVLMMGISGIITLQVTFPFSDKDTGFTDVKKAAGGLLDYLLMMEDTVLILHGSLGQTLSDDVVNFVDLLSNLADDEALSFLNTKGHTFADQKQLMMKLKFHFQSGDPHSLDDLNL
eukprot:scaffold185528_cov51-Attheya_sp.AAC.5